MSYVPSNLKSAVICETQKEGSDVVHLLFKVAFAYAQKGLNVCILNNSQIDEFALEEEYLLYPEILQRINFRYLKTSEEVIRWCHEIHYLIKKPSLLLIPLHHFVKSDDFQIVSLCGALVDALIYLSNFEKSKQFNLLASTLIDFDSCFPYLHTYFNCSWKSSKVNSSIHLKPYKKNNFNKQTNLASEIIINSNSKFDELNKIFEEHP